MKLKYSIMLLVISLVFSCEKYEDFALDSIGYTTIYFPSERLERSMISGEGMSIDVGVFLGGVKTNNEDRVIQFEIEDSDFLNDWNTTNGRSYELLPDNFYTLSSSSEIVVQPGGFQGFVTVQFDSLAIANATDFTDFRYALPFRISENTSSVDSILPTKQTTVIPVKVMNTHEGNYWQIGEMKKFFNIDRVIDGFVSYGDSLETRTTPVRILTTTGMNTVMVDGVGNITNAQMELMVNSDHSVNLIPVTPEYQITPNGSNSWDPVKRRFTLNYKYTIDEFSYEVSEILFFRDRNRDGINEWRWKGFPGSTF